MAGITQTIPSYTGGISEQPDALKIPGQVTTAQNVYPDFTYGLRKRPGSQFIKKLEDSQTVKWFHFYRNDSVNESDKNYIGRVDRDGAVKIWRCSDGADCSITQPANTLTYLAHTYDDDLDSLTINDHTFITNRNQIVSMASVVEPVRPPEAFVELKKVAYGRQYQVYCYDKAETVEITTATEIKVERIVDTGNACDSSGDWPSSKDEAGTTDSDRDEIMWVGGNYTGWSGSSSSPDEDDTAAGRRISRYASGNTTDYTSRCTSGSTKDGNCAGTNNFVVYKNNPTDNYPVFRPRENKGDTIVFTGNESTDIEAEVPSSFSVNAREGSNKTSYEIPRDLVFRIHTICQAMPVAGDDGDPAVDYYTSRYTTTWQLLNGGIGWKEGDWFNVYDNYTWYRVTIEKVSTSEAFATLSNIKGDGVIAPKPTSFDATTVTTADSILGELRSELIATDAFTTSRVQVIGQGIYITRVAEQDVSASPGDPDYDSFGTFNIMSPNSELLNVLSDSVNDVGDLPQECKHGYVVKVANSGPDHVEEDDYYVKFQGNNGLDGEGVWEECPRPGVELAFDPDTMPVQVIWKGSTSFEIDNVAWNRRAVGDDTTNPVPSFVGNAITGLVYYKNRLGFLSGSSVILSSPNDLFHFWAQTALTVSDEDAIDLDVTSAQPADLKTGLDINNGLLLFSDTQQFAFGTDDSVLSPRTARINKVANLSCNTKVRPVDFGSTIAFIDNTGRNGRLYEIVDIPREGQPVTVEQSRVVPDLLPKNLNILINSVDNNVALLAEKDSNDIYGFRYLNTGGEQRPQAWFKWKICGKFRYGFVVHDILYAVIKYGDDPERDVLQKFDLSLGFTEDLVTEGSIDYRVHLDNTTTISTTSLSYDKFTNETTFTVPVGAFDGDDNCSPVIYVSDTDAGNDVGKYTPITLSGTTGTITGDWTSSTTYDINIGYLFDMDIQIPKIYYTTATGQSFITDQPSSLIIHRVKFNFGDTGVFETTLSRPGKDDYTELYESLVMNGANTNTVAFDDEQSQTIPIYERNTNVTLNLKSSHPSPATLHSMSWEGDYSTRYYQRV